MGTFLDSLSKSTVESLLHISEVMLLLSGAVLLIGIWGEYRKDEKWKKYSSIFAMMVLLGIGVELIGDAGVFVFSESLQRLEGADIQALDIKAQTAGEKANNALTKSGEADNTSKGAMDKAGKAEQSSTNALSLARGARQEADSFEKDIVSAKAQAADAESHLAEALRRAADATSALDRLKSPRSLTDISKLISALATFKNTEYTFSSVGADEESLTLLKSVDDLLQKAEWKRGKPVGGFPAINVFGSDAQYSVPVALTNGIRISVDSPEDISVLKSLTLDKLPMPVSAAATLYTALSTSLSPQEEHPNLVDVVKGESMTVRISIGKKP
jgi:hypothetical protein